jgi:hypothetical protein
MKTKYIKKKLDTNEMSIILNDVFDADNIKFEYYKKYDLDRPRFKIFRYSEKLSKKVPIATVETFVIGTIFFDGSWLIDLSGFSGFEYEFKVEAGYERDYIEMISDFIDEIFVVKEANSRVFSKYSNIKRSPKIELREFKLNKIL